MKTCKSILIFSWVILAFFLSESHASGQVRKESSQRITAILQARLDSITTNKYAPGATLSVRLGERTNIAIASGLADVENNIQMKPDDVMFSGSVGKTYVSAVILKLHEQGLVDLNVKAIDYLSDKPWFLKVPNATDITVEMLLNHTAGVPEYVYEKEIWETIKQNPDKEWSVEERLSCIFDDTATNAAGKGWSYADSHYLILGLIIEKVTGKSYYDVLKDVILKPYNLIHTYPSVSRSLPGLVPGYTGLTEVFLLPRKVVKDSKFAFNPQMEWTGGGLASTTSDLTAWARNLYGGDVLTPESKKLMFVPAPFRTFLPENAKYGLGCFIGETNGILYYGHTGFMPGYITYLQYLPDYDIAIALQYNTDSFSQNFSMVRFFNAIKKDVLELYKK